MINRFVIMFPRRQTITIRLLLERFNSFKYQSQNLIYMNYVYLNQIFEFELLLYERKITKARNEIQLTGTKLLSFLELNSSNKIYSISDHWGLVASSITWPCYVYSNYVNYLSFNKFVHERSSTCTFNVYYLNNCVSTMRIIHTIWRAPVEL